MVSAKCPHQFFWTSEACPQRVSAPITPLMRPQRQDQREIARSAPKRVFSPILEMLYIPNLIIPKITTPPAIFGQFGASQSPQKHLQTQNQRRILKIQEQKHQSEDHPGPNFSSFWVSFYMFILGFLILINSILIIVFHLFHHTMLIFINYMIVCVISLNMSG